MTGKYVDCSGLSCPEPVIQVRKALQELGANEVKVKVDSTVARDNVARSGKALGWNVRITPEDDYFMLTLTK
ncbi:MAG: sulfurtransferase TusA family protein [Bacillota bacterium]|nr:sulfurtransferase TusA family protein [Bacillota bacterium]